MLEIGAIAVILLAAIAQGLFLYRMVPPLALITASAGDALPLPVHVYLRFSVWSLMVVATALMVWIGAHFSGWQLRASIRRRVLVTTAAVAVAATIAGLYVTAEANLKQAMRLHGVFAASAQVMERDLSNLSLASGNPDQVIALLDAKVSRPDFITNVYFGGPGRAFQLAEAYRAKGDLASARRLYLRAQQAAAGVDEVLTPRFMDRKKRWQSQFGSDFDFWLPEPSEMKLLAEQVRTVSQQRLDELTK